MDERTTHIPSSAADAEFDELLRSVRVKLPLPDSFQARVWRRIVVAQEASPSARFARCVEVMLGELVRPIPATTSVLLMTATGMLFGSMSGASAVNEKAYIESISPFAHPHQEDHP